MIFLMLGRRKIFFNNSGRFQGAFRIVISYLLLGEMLCICMFVLLSRVYAVMYVDDSVVLLCFDCM